MIQTLWATNPDGNTLELNLRSSEEDHGLLVFNMSGLGPPKGTVTGTAGPGYDGMRGTFVRTDARHIILTLAVTATGDAEETAKQLIYDYFPIKGTIVLGITTDAKDVYTEAIVETNEFNQFAKVENAVIGLYCANPWFLDLLSDEVSLPMNTEKNIPYNGDVSTGVYMSLTFGGTVSNVYITNDNGGQALYIDLSSVGPALIGDKLYIDTRIGQKSIIFETFFGIQTSLLPALGMGDDWIQLHRGDNNIEMAASVNPDSSRPSNLVAYYPGNEVHGGKLLEHHAGKDLIRSSGAIGSGPGLNIFRYPTARDFPGTTDSLFENSAPDPDLCPVGDFSIVFWANVDVFSDYNYIMHTVDAAGDNGYWLRARSDGNLQFNIASGGVDLTRNLPMATAGTWAIYYLWYDVAADYFYMQKDDGTPVTKLILDPPLAYSSSKTFIGGISSGDEFDGRLQSIMFYDGLLTGANFTWLRNIGNGRTYAETAGVVETKMTFSTKFQGV